MLLEQPRGAHLTYCTNVHPGEALAEVEALVTRFVTEVKRSVAPAQPFGVGLRLAGQAASELAGEALERFAALLEHSGLYCFTLNGFPFGTFHGARVKEDVYRPDWLEPERVSYTRSLARILARLLPAEMTGSISTVPGCFKPRGQAQPDSEQRIARQIAQTAATLVEIERATGKHLELALEPEPHCLLETTDEAIRFFEQSLFAAEPARELARATGMAQNQAERALRHHVGVCLDTCHASVEFESPLESFHKLERAAIRVPKIQISAGLRLAPATRERRDALVRFQDPVYLHQTVARSGERLTRFLDLDEALASAPSDDSEWRVHFHVPIFLSELGVFESTASDLLPLLAALKTAELCPHLEVETYTWDVLPPEFRSSSVTEAIARELKFVLRAFGATSQP